MAPPQVNLNEKPAPTPSEGDGSNTADKKEALLSSLADRYNDLAHDPLPEKKDSGEAAPVIVTMAGAGDRSRCGGTNLAEMRRQRKRCRVACCASLSFLLVLLLALGTACLVYRMKHRRHWKSWCGTQEGDRIPEHVKVDHQHQLIVVSPDTPTGRAMGMMHEYNRRLIAFKNSTANVCYIDRLDETFSEGYSRWQGYEESEHQMNRTLRVLPQRIDVEVVKHIAGVHIYEHCGSTKVEYYWVMEVTQEEVRLRPTDKYIRA